MVTGHIRKRIAKDGKVSYQIILETDKDPMTGKRRRFYKTVNGTKKEAESQLNQLIYEMSHGGSVMKPSTVKLSDWMNTWMRLYTTHLSPTTIEGYRSQVETRIIPNLGKIPIASLTTNEVQAWVNWLSKDQGLSAQTVKNIFLNLKAALDMAKKQKMISSNPCENIILPSIKQYKANVYTITQMKQVLAVAKGTDMYLIAVIEAYLGLRKGEIAALKWDDIDFETGVVHILRSRVTVNGVVIEKSPKSEAGVRDLWLGAEALQIFKDEYSNYLSETKKTGFKATGYVVHKENGEPFVPDSISQKWDRFREAHHLPKIRFHDLRHTYATAMIAAGVDPKTVQTRLGHSDIQVTLNTYSHCLPTMNKAAGDTMDLLLNTGT